MSSMSSAQIVDVTTGKGLTLTGPPPPHHPLHPSLPYHRPPVRIYEKKHSKTKCL